MGLDMYALTSTDKLPAAVDFKPEEEGVETIHRWRKHPNLHGWMEQLHFEKGSVLINWRAPRESFTRREPSHLLVHAVQQ